VRLLAATAALAATVATAACGGPSPGPPGGAARAATPGAPLAAGTSGRPAAAGPSGEAPGAGRSGGAAGPGRSGGAAAVPASLSFTGRTLDGTPFDAATLAGRPTLLWFWAPWCATCAGQADQIIELREQYGDRLAILGVAGLGDNAAMREFVTDLDVDTVPNLDDQAGEVWRRFGVTEQSTFVLIDRRGTVVETKWLDRIDLPARVQSLVA
jgi:thiol-disulfide isomerase/thioredoxin